MSQHLGQFDRVISFRYVLTAGWPRGCEAARASIDGKVDCSQMKEGGAIRPCEAFTPPHKVAVGETFSAEGKTRQIGIIRCVAAETLEDIPVDQSRNRIWLAITKCQPDLPGNAPLPPG